MKAKRAWIVIADGSRARVLEIAGAKFNEIEDMAATMDLPPNRELQSDRPGRSFESANSTRHALEERVDPHRELKRTLAKMLIANLGRALSERRFDRLVLVAPPTMLGDLRDALTDALRGTVVAELAKDLVKVPQNELWEHLGEISIDTRG